MVPLSGSGPGTHDLRTRLWSGIALVGVVFLLLTSCTTGTSSSHGKEGYCGSTDANSVTVIIDYGDLGPDPTVGCAYDLPEGATGFDALQALGITVTQATRSQDFICRLEGYPTIDQIIPIPGRDTYRETCVNTPPQTAYWTYWNAAEGEDWTYATRGYTTNPVIFGGFEGFAFAHNVPLASAPPGIPATTP